MDKETLQDLISRISTGKEPIVIMRPENGDDSIKVKFTDYHNHIFSGISDDLESQKVRIREEILLHGHYKITLP